MSLVATSATLVFSVLSYSYGMGVIRGGMVKAPECERHHVVMDPLNETLWTFSPYGLRRHELRLLNLHDNVELLIPGQMLCVKALETKSAIDDAKTEEIDWRPAELQNFMKGWSRVVSIVVTTDETNEPKYCTGTILDERTVLTTASCAYKALEENVKVVLGVGDTSFVNKLFSIEERPEKPVLKSKADIEKIVAHPGYSPENSQSHNLAVLFLKERTKLQSPERKLELPAETAGNIEETDSPKWTFVAQRNYWWQWYKLLDGIIELIKAWLPKSISNCYFYIAIYSKTVYYVHPPGSRTELDLLINNGLILVDARNCRERFWVQGYDDFYLSEDMLGTVMDPDEYFNDVCRECNGAALVLYDGGSGRYLLIGVGVAASGNCTEMKGGHDYVFVDLRHKSNWEWL